VLGGLGGARAGKHCAPGHPLPPIVIVR
jgi:hypothetical protein